MYDMSRKLQLHSTSLSDHMQHCATQSQHCTAEVQHVHVYLVPFCIRVVSDNSAEMSGESVYTSMEFRR